MVLSTVQPPDSLAFPGLWIWVEILDSLRRPYAKPRYWSATRHPLFEFSSACCHQLRLRASYLTIESDSVLWQVDTALSFAEHVPSDLSYLTIAQCEHWYWYMVPYRRRRARYQIRSQTKQSDKHELRRMLLKCLLRSTLCIETIILRLYARCVLSHLPFAARSMHGDVLAKSEQTR